MEQVRAELRAELKVRLAPALKHAIRAKAAEAGLSANSFAVHVLAAAVGAEFFRVPERPEDPPRTIAESRDQQTRTWAVMQEARSVFTDHLLENGRESFRRFTDEEALEYYEEVWLPARRTPPAHVPARAEMAEPL